LALSDLLQALNEEGIRICSFETTNTQWRFVFLQHEVALGVQLIKKRCTVVDYEYYPAMLSFIGCRDLTYLQDQLNEQQNSEATPLYQSATSIHMLSKRVDISRMLDEMMVLVAQGTDHSA
jgi:hypothetical protein